MNYYIYENWQAGPHKAVIHQENCGHCNYGKGVAGGYDPSHAKWHGPFSSLDEARQTAASIAGVVVNKECGHCIKT